MASTDPSHPSTPHPSAEMSDRFSSPAAACEHGVKDEPGYAANNTHGAALICSSAASAYLPGTRCSSLGGELRKLGCKLGFGELRSGGGAAESAKGVRCMARSYVKHDGKRGVQSSYLLSLLRRPIVASHSRSHLLQEGAPHAIHFLHEDSRSGRERAK